MKKILAFSLFFIPFLCGAQVARQELTILIGTDTIYGTLVLPTNVKRPPLMLLQAGSGPTDRNGNNPLGVKANSYAMLADSLAANGIATWLYDKRMIAQSYRPGMKEENIAFSDYINDMATMAHWLFKNKKLKRIFFAGHSEGSLIAAAASKQFKKTKGVISIAGIGYRIDSVLVNQLSAQSAQLGHVADSLFQRLAKDQPIDTINIFLQSLFRPSIQPYMKSWMSYAPCEVFKGISKPLLIINGTNDIQVSADNAEHLKQCNPQAQLLIINSMNHVLKNSPADRSENMKTYSQPDLPLNKMLSDAIITFIKLNK